jgi:hypothetical protein
MCFGSRQSKLLSAPKKRLAPGLPNNVGKLGGGLLVGSLVGWFFVFVLRLWS